MKDIKQVIVVRKDLNLRKTELASQVATASMGFLLENNESERNDIINVKLSNEEVLWLNGSFEKLIVGVDSEEDLRDLMFKAEMEGIGVYPVHGKIKRGPSDDDMTIMCAALGPDDSKVINHVTGHLKSI
jgi:PTH2 family peptidyl-tRNA hydrolase